MARKKNTVTAPTTAAVIYARYSSHSQKEESIEQQVDECMAFAVQNGLKVIDVYSDKAISGKTDRRSSFQRMMRDAEKRQFAVVIAYKSNRMSRNMLQALTYEAKLEQYGIRTLYAKEEFGNSAAGRFALRTMMNVNQFYSENMAEDIRRGLADNAANCKVNGALPLGYIKGPDGKYAIDEPAAEVVREIYDRVIMGHSYASIAENLNARGIKTKSGGRWNKNSFHRMLENDVYIGVYRHSGVVVKGGVPPIIEKGVFDTVQDILDKKRARGRAENADYLLTGKLYCGHCNSYMVGVSGTSRTGSKHYYYMCNSRRLNQGCKKEYVRRDYIERKVAELTMEVILRDDVIEWIADSTISFQMLAKRESDLSTLESELSAQRKAAKNIMTAIEQGIITPTTKERLLEIESEIESLQTTIKLVKAAAEPEDRDLIIWTLTKMREGNIDDKATQRKLFDTFVKAVYLWDDHIQIDYYHSKKFGSIMHTIDKESGAGGVLTDSPQLHHNAQIRTEAHCEECICVHCNNKPRVIRLGVYCFLLRRNYKTSYPTSRPPFSA